MFVDVTAVSLNEAVSSGSPTTDAFIVFALVRRSRLLLVPPPPGGTGGSRPLGTTAKDELLTTNSRDKSIGIRILVMIVVL
jgi:hypothetical protein